MPGLAPGTDNSHSWSGAPTYDRTSPRTVTGWNDLTIFGVKTGIEHSTLLPVSDILWNHGFWLYDRGTNPIKAIVYDPDSNNGTLEIPTLYEIGASPDEGRSLPDINPMISADGDFLWFSVRSELHYSSNNINTEGVVVGETEDRVFCVSRNLSIAANQLIVSGSIYMQGGLGLSSNRFPATASSITDMYFSDPYTLVVEYFAADGWQSGEYLSKTVEVTPLEEENAVDSECFSFDYSSIDDSFEGLDTVVLGVAVSVNPVTDTAALNFSTPVTGHASVQVFDLSGRTVDTLVNEEVAAGNHSVNWTPENISSGVYFVRLTTTAGTVSTQAMVLR